MTVPLTGKYYTVKSKENHQNSYIVSTHYILAQYTEHGTLERGQHKKPTCIYVSHIKRTFTKTFSQSFYMNLN